MDLAIPWSTGHWMLRAGCGRAAPARGAPDPARHHARRADAGGDGAARGRAGDMAVAGAAAGDLARARARAFDMARRVVLTGHVDRTGAALDVAVRGAVRAGVSAVVVAGAHAVIARARLVGGHAPGAEDGRTTQEHQADEGLHVPVIREPAPKADITATSPRQGQGFAEHRPQGSSRSVSSVSLPKQQFGVGLGQSSSPSRHAATLQLSPQAVVRPLQQ